MRFDHSWLFGWIFVWGLVGVAAMLASVAVEASDAPASVDPVIAVTDPLPGAAAGDSPARRLTSEDLQLELFHFVDRYRERIGQVCDEGVVRSASGAKRVLFQATKVSYVSAAMSIVSGPRPIDALRDLLVVLTLQRMVWESGAGGQIEPADSVPVARVLRTLEVEAYALASRAIPHEAIVKLRFLAEEWRRQNWDQHYVAFVRFQNLKISPVADEVDSVISSGGLLAPVESVAREAHEARLFAERSLYLANRMPALIGWQSELAYMRIATTPEATEFLGNLGGYRATLKQMSEAIDQLPANVAKERQAFLKDMAKRIENERIESLRSMQSLIRGEREAFFRSLSEGARIYGPMLTHLATTAAATRDAVAGIERLSAFSSTDTFDVDLVQVREIVERLSATARNTNDLVAGLNAVMNSEMRGLMALDAMLASHTRRIFIYAVVLVLLFGVVLYVALRAVRRRAT